MTQTQSLPWKVAALYQFTPFDNLEKLQKELRQRCEALDICGTLLIAHEGINGTIAGHDGQLDAMIAHLRALPGCADMDVKYSIAETRPFFRMKVRLKKEIVSMGLPDIKPPEQAGTYIPTDKWNDLISDPDTIIIDTRNDYEIAIGSFKGAINPETTNFREFPQWFDDFAKDIDKKDKKIAMFCTGGIRCEKATAYVKEKGYDNVFHLKGGILQYLEDVEEKESLWDGSCFVFDQRVAVDHGLKLADYHLCRACRHPLGPEDLKHEDYIEGEQCKYCANIRSEGERARYRERYRQEQLAAERGRKHIGRSE